MDDPWIETMHNKLHEIERLASWASLAGYGDVRNSLRRATFRLQERIEDRLMKIAGTRDPSGDRRP